MLADRNERIFLCHASEDGERVACIHRQLKAAGLNPWLDQQDLPPAREWDVEIRKALGAVRLVVVCLSSHLVAKSGYVQREIEIALETARQLPPGSTFVIPVRLDPCPVPEVLGGLEQFDLFEGSDIDELAEYLKTVLGLFTDARDGQIYRTLRIGQQTWLAANLNHPVADSWSYDDDPVNVRRYGRLYTWEAAQRACPEGWHVATDSEWKTLAEHTGGYRDMDEGYPGTGMRVGRPQVAFESLLAGGASGFAACLGGYRRSTGEFVDLGRAGVYWTSTAYRYSDVGNFEPIGRRDIESAWIYSFYLMSSAPEVRRDYQLPLRADVHPRGCGLSVRCVRNS